ncbi:MAG: pyrroline-5-carboxylate reductase [Alphaproteobacteria bacterium]|nr:MAG: pyrroline-5-carboxylate reductase [Alphaproteobacteria bacterium]
MTAKLSSIQSENPLVLIGGGRMGAAMLSGWLAGGLDVSAVTVVEPFETTREALSASHAGLQVVSSIDDVAATPSIVILAVKPQVMGDVMAPLRAWDKALFVSIAAGKTLGYFEAHLGADRSIIRVMPNTPAAVGAGISVAVGNAQVTADHKSLATALLQAVGMVDWVEDEGLIDAVTAVSGSGPAYVFHLVEAMTQAGIAAGLDAPLASRLARQTVIGSGVLMAEDDADAATLRQNVTSPGGTTQAALDVLMGDNRLVDLLTEAIAAAKKRSTELSS